MYASFRSVTAKNGKILTPTRTGNFSLTSMDWEFYAMWKSFDLFYKIWFILGMVALLEACDVTNNGRRLCRHLRLYQELEIRLKPRLNGNFFGVDIQISTLHDLSRKVYFYC